MSDGKKIRRLNRLQLVEIMYDQEQQLKKLQEQNEYLKNYIKQQSIELREQKEIINLLSKFSNTPLGFNADNTLTITGADSSNQVESTIIVPPEVVNDVSK